MDENGVETLDESAGRSTLGRRRLLKGAAAAGVGVAVWSTPSITSIGGTPAYAAVCTAPVVTYGVGTSSSACNCGQNPNKYAAYFPLDSNACGLPASPIAVTLTNGLNGPPLGNNTCPPTDGGAHALIAPNTLGLKCKVEVVVTLGNCSGTFVTSVTSGVLGTGGGSIAMPQALCQGGGNLFLSVRLKCSKQSACL